MQNIAKNSTIKTDKYNSNITNTNDIKENIEEEDRKNLKLLTADLYSYAIAIMRLYYIE